MSRWVVVDNTDSNIQYSNTGAWSSIDGAPYDKKGNFGNPYQGTLQSTTASQASFSYTFQGSKGKILGTTNVKSTNGVKDPTWECKVDDTVITLGTPFAYTENNWVLCQWDENVAPPGRHTVTITAKSNGQAFLFDDFQYLPSSGINVENAEISVPFDDAKIQYGGGWQNYGTIGKMAPDGGAVVTFPFHGTGITWIGTIPKELPSGSATAEYSIDQQSTTTFTLAGNPGSTTQYIQKVFQVGGLSLGHHTLVVTSRGKTSLTPLVLNNFIIQGGSLQEPTSTGSTSGNSGSSGNSGNSGNKGSTSVDNTSSTSISSGSKASATSLNSGTSIGVSATASSSVGGSSPSDAALAGNIGTGTDHSDANNNGGSSSTPIGPIVGGVVGGILVILLIVAFFIYRRRARRNRMKHDYQQKPKSEFGYTEHAQPFFTEIAGPNPTYSHSESADGSFYHQPQTAYTGNSNAIVSSKNARAVSNPDSYYFSNAANSSSASPPTSPAPFLVRNAHGNYPPSSLASGMVSVSGSSEYLLEPNRASSKSQEASSESSRTGTSHTMIVNHEDSGYRIPQSTGPPPPAGIIEYPPMYTPA